jgi:two-component system chemotaxis response regulator CheY
MSKIIMVVDDSKAVRAVIGATLKLKGFTTLTAEDGRDALAQLQQKGAGPMDLIITDVNMPNMDGPTFIRELKKLPAYAATPVCVLTTESEQGRLEQGLSGLQQAWITKPVQPAQVLKVISELLGV